MLFNGDLTTECPIRQRSVISTVLTKMVIDHILPLAEAGGKRVAERNVNKPLF